MTVLERLFTPSGQPAQTTRERQFLRDLRRLHTPLETALSDLEQALETENVEQGIIASRRALAVGYVLADAAREVERG